MPSTSSNRDPSGRFLKKSALPLSSDSSTAQLQLAQPVAPPHAFQAGGGSVQARQAFASPHPRQVAFEDVSPPLDDQPRLSPRISPGASQDRPEAIFAGGLLDAVNAPSLSAPGPALTLSVRSATVIGTESRYRSLSPGVIVDQGPLNPQVIQY